MYLNNISYSNYKVRVLWLDRIRLSEDHVEYAVYADGVHLKPSNIIYIDGTSYNAESLYKFLEANGSQIFNMLRQCRKDKDGTYINTMILVKASKIDMEFRKIISIEYKDECSVVDAIDICDIAILNNMGVVVTLIDFFLNNTDYSGNIILVALHIEQCTVTISVKDVRKFQELLAKRRIVSRR